MPTGSGTIMMAKDPTGKYKDCRMDAEGNLKCELTSSIDVAIGDVEMIGTANVDGSGAKRHVVVDAAGQMTTTNATQLPSALTGSGNLKVCLQELGNEGSERLNVDVGTLTQLPSALTGEGNLKVSIQEDHGHLLSTAALQTSGNTTLTSLDGKISKGKDATAAGAELQQVLIYGKKDDGTLQPLECLGDRLLVDVVELAASGKITTSSALSSIQVCGFNEVASKFRTLDCDANGHLSVEDKRNTVIEPTLQQADTTQIQRVNISLHDVGNSTTRTAKCDANGRLIVTADAITAGDAATLTTAQQNLMYGRSGASALQALAVDANGHLQVDVLSGAGGGDATAANQTTAIGHLSEIEGAVETLEGCVNSNKIRVELEAGDLNVGNVDVVSASGNTQLPTSLGQKANANCLATCRSSTAGAYDLSARTTIGTASTTTKLACSAAGSLMCKTASNTSNGGPTNTATIAASALGHTEGLSADNTFANVYLMIDTADSGVLQDAYVMVARTNTATSDYFLHTVVLSGGGPGSVGVEWTQLPGTTRYYAHVHIRKPPEFIGIYNGGPSANKIAVLYNYGVE